MPKYYSKDEELVAYDYHTNLKHSSYKNIYFAASFFGVRTKEIAASIRDNTYLVGEVYFKVSPRRSFKQTKREE